MKHKRIIVIAAILALVICFLLNRNSRVEQKSEGVNKNTNANPNLANLPSQPPSLPLSERRKLAVDRVLSMLSTPITFYGKAVDQFGKPIVGATVEYGAADKFMESGSDYTSTTDNDGFFGITNIVGAYLTVGLRKDGYDTIDGKSTGAFGYGAGVDSQRKAPPTKDNPAIFVLRKKAIAEPLYFIDSYFKIPRNGSPVEVNLKTGKRAVANNGDIQIECWTNDQTKDAKGRYEWHCRFSVPGGGLVERGNQLEPHAPPESYQSEVQISMTPDVDRWKSNFSGDYFLKTGSGNYARIRLKMIAGGDHFVSIQSYYNPKPNSRNLEYDATKLNPTP